MTAERMQTLVRATRERGWSLIGNHATRGVLAVGMAVPDARGLPVAAVSVASTDLRMNRERQKYVVQRIRDELKRGLPQGLPV
jgi:DNA-binding IclR family transcriptional regulator